MRSVSIILPTYNGAVYIERAIVSIQSQSYSNWELIIIDDASTDATPSIITSLAQKDTRIKTITNKQNLKLPKTLNRGLSEANGIYIARIDDDDVWTDSQKLQKQVTYLDEHPDCVLVGTFFRRVDEKGIVLSNPTFPITDQKIRSCILSSNPFGHSTVMFKTSTVKELSGYDETLPYTEDYDLWLRLGRKGTIANIPYYSVEYTVRQGMSAANKKKGQIKYQFRILRKYYMYYPGRVKAFCRWLAYIFFY